MTTYNTAGAARMIAERRERRAAAVASPRVAALYGLEILADDIQAGEENRTRFAVLALAEAAAPATAPPATARPAPATAPPAFDPAFRTTLVFAVRNVPGSLHRCLGAFAARGVNLSSLESRPARRARWEYVFWGRRRCGGRRSGLCRGAGRPSAGRPRWSGSSGRTRALARTDGRRLARRR